MDASAQRILNEMGELCRKIGSEWIHVMEVCGTHTMSIARAGLRALLPTGLKLTSGPGCPVCVTDQSYMDQAIDLARRSGMLTATYGDMVRVPGRYGSLGEARSQGAKVEIVVSADKVVDLAKANPDLQVVFLAVGFETTTPATALAVLRAQREKVTNFSVLAAHKLVLPALAALLTSDVRIDGFLMPGHVSVILGYGAYEKIAIEHGKPCVVAGFDALQIIKGLLEILRELASGKPQACTVYPTVHREGNPHALKLFEDVFQPCDARWRAIGVIPKSGLELKPEFAAFDAAKKFELPEMESYELPGCRCGEVITGRCSPFDCPLFGRRCTPRDPVGPCMVSSEGACAAAYKYERVAKP